MANMIYHKIYTLINSYTKQLIFVYHVDIEDGFSEENIEISGMPMQPDKTRLKPSLSDPPSPDMLSTPSSKE